MDEPIFKNERVIVRKSPGKGYTYFANRDFAKGDSIIEVNGRQVDEPTDYTVPIGFGKYIDPAEDGGKYLCHSCDPNMGFHGLTNIVAFKDIKKGDELAVDYAMFVPFYIKDSTGATIMCECGSENCDGRLRSFFSLSDEKREEYKGFISPYLLEITW